MMIGLGSSVNILVQQNRNDWRSNSFGYNLGFYSSRSLTDKYSFLIGMSYYYVYSNNYVNSVRYTSNWVGGPEESDVNLATTFKQNYFQIPLIIKRYISNKISIGVGLNFSILLSSRFSQEAVGNYSISKYPLADSSFNAMIKFVFGVKDYVSNAPFTKTNIAPVVHVEYSLTKRLNLEYILSYDIVSNPRLQYKFNEYNTLNNNLVFTFKFN